jgi:SAM-dependent methyltransferase
MTPPTPSQAGLAPASVDHALSAYEPFAAFYDEFTRDYEYDPWLDAIETWARAHGLRGRRLLDVACGTGKSFARLMAKGYAVTACDLSPAMVAKARRKAGDAAEVIEADMRSLPWRSRFDLLTCLDDAINYLLTPADLQAAIGSMAAALRPGGVAVFDVNSLLTYRTTFAEDFEVVDGATRFRWRGEGSPDAEPGAVSSATIEIEAPAGQRLYSRHLQRHWPLEVLRTTCGEAGFGQIVFRGQFTGGRLAGEPDQGIHPKVLCLATRPRRRRRRGESWS